MRRAPLLALLLLTACPGGRAPFLVDQGSDADASTSDSSKPQVDGHTTTEASGPKPDVARWPEAGGGCGPTNCSGCCQPGGSCGAGNADTRCGRTGMVCIDCTASKTVCQLGKCCKPACSGKTCGVADGCGGTCKAGSGCCTPKCQGKKCGVADGCGSTCKAGSGCCTPTCAGKKCGSGDGCGGTCTAGTGCCTPQCAGKKCGSGDGCGGSCVAGSGCCTPSCSGKKCGASDGCSGTCSGSCPQWEKCSSSKKCVCSPSPHRKKVNGVCLPSCGQFLSSKGLPDKGGGCCTSGCKSGTYGGGPWDTHDCKYCCSSTVKGVGSCQ